MIKHETEDSTTKAISFDFTVTLTAIVHPEGSGGFSAEVPALPGCFTEGETLEELQANLREAAEGWLKAHHDLVLMCPDGGPSEGADGP